MRTKTLLTILLLTFIGNTYIKAQTLSQDIAAIADITVDKNGTKDYTTIQAALNAIPDNNASWKVVFVKNGVYEEKVILHDKKTNVILVGENVDSTIITFDDYGDKMLPGGHTFSTYTFRADPNDFQAYNITFQNPSTDGQAVAFHSNGDRQILYHCRLLGNQDTYFDNFRTRRYIKDCFIEGGVDFIFGFGVSLFDSCQIHNNRDKGYYTAAATPENYEFGYVFKNCRLTTPPDVTNYVSLGRPWFPYSNTVFYECWETDRLNPSGWTNWDGRGKTCHYREYNCFGPGSDTTARIYFGKQLDPVKSSRYTIETILSADNFPADLGELADSLELWSFRNRFAESGYAPRADTVLYAGRDAYPEYPTDDWVPSFYTPVHQVITNYTKPFFDESYAQYSINQFFWDDNEVAYFDEEINYFPIELPSDYDTIPTLSVNGEGITTYVNYPNRIPEVAEVSVVAANKVDGALYEVYFSIDSIFWTTLPKLVLIDGDTIKFEKGITNYSYDLISGAERVSTLRIDLFPEQKKKYTYPKNYPGDLTIQMVAPNRTDTVLYSIYIGTSNDVNEHTTVNFSGEIRTVKDQLYLAMNEEVAEPTTVTLYTVSGRQIHTQHFKRLTKGNTNLGISPSELLPGVYLYRIANTHRSGSGKIVIK